MKYKINSYFAILIITIFGAGASLLIIRVAYANTFQVVFVGGGEYLPLQESILK